MNKITLKVKKKARDEAREIAKKVSEEILEIPKGVVKETVGKESSPDTSVSEAMKQKTQGTDIPIEFSKYKSEKKKKLDYLEKELEELKRKKITQEKQEMISQSQLEERKEQENEAEITLIEPQTKRKVGLPFFGKGKQKTKGTGEILKSKK